MRKRKGYLALLLVTNFLIILSSEMLGPIYAFFIEDVGGGVLEAGMTVFAFSIAGGITTILSGRFLDLHRKHARNVVVIGYLLISTGFFLLMGLISLSSALAMLLLE